MTISWLTARHARWDFTKPPFADDSIWPQGARSRSWLPARPLGNECRNPSVDFSEELPLVYNVPLPLEACRAGSDRTTNLPCQVGPCLSFVHGAPDRLRDLHIDRDVPPRSCEPEPCQALFAELIERAVDAQDDRVSSIAAQCDDVRCLSSARSSDTLAWPMPPSSGPPL